MNEIQTWDYDASVERMRAVVYKWHALTVDMFAELWTARDALSKTGRPESGTSVPLRTWAEYCGAIGIVKRTANRWLERYDPVERKILPGPEAVLSLPDSPKDGYAEAFEAAVDHLDDLAAEGARANATEKRDEILAAFPELDRTSKELLRNHPEPLTPESYSVWMDSVAYLGDLWKYHFRGLYDLREWFPQYQPFGLWFDEECEEQRQEMRKDTDARLEAGEKPWDVMGTFLKEHGAVTERAEIKQ